jgi:hypothetical protein
MNPRVGASVLILVAVPAWSRAQVPAGPEFRVNTYTTLGQTDIAQASAADGDFVVVWRTFAPGSYVYPVSGQRFDAAGPPRGAEFRVDQGTITARAFPDVASDASGAFVVAWHTLDDGDVYGIAARRYDSAGEPRGGEFGVNSYTESGQSRPVVAADPRGNFVVAWQSVGQDGNLEGVFARRFDATAAPQGIDFRVNTYVVGQQRFADVAIGAAGDFVIVWQSLNQDGSSEGVYAQRYDASGAPRGLEFRVNTYTTSAQSRPAVAVDPAGNFVVAWRSLLQDGSAYGVFAQRYDAAGAPRGGEFRVNTYTLYNQESPAVASDSHGNFVVAWQSVSQDGSFTGVFAQRYDAAGVPRGAEFRVNTYTAYAQEQPAVSSDASGNFVVSWESTLQDGSDRGVFAQRFGGLVPAALEADTAGNRVFEPGEAVDLRPTWRNVNGLAQTFGGTLANISGPGGPLYSIGDATASYGTVANGVSAQCIDCYGVSVSAPPTRPVLHWDASVTESITPDAQGQQVRWLLHLGDSFVDVPRGSPFYRFIETLLHRGITGGCAGNSYCPSNSTTREQMAVFVLLAKEGGGYLPPPCVPPNVFDDVPESSPFCRFIEDLSNRGVVSGCGGGNYCPTAAVTREQMAVFVLRTLDPALSPPPCTTPVFADVPASSPFCRWIEELARRGVVSGCGGGNYCPAAAVTREQMGVFLGATFSLTLYGP